MCAAHDRFLMYPEGTRRASQPNADEPVELQRGGLKNIWESGIHATCVITVNKELIVDERRGRVSALCGLGPGATVFRACSPAILASDYDTFESFYEVGSAAQPQRHMSRLQYARACKLA